MSGFRPQAGWRWIKTEGWTVVTCHPSVQKMALQAAQELQGLEYFEARGQDQAGAVVVMTFSH